MVLSDQVRDIIEKQSEINSIHNEYKSLIPGNDIPDTKRVYHNNMLKISEKTINLKSPKSTKEEIIVKKEDIKEDDKEFAFDEIIEISEGKEEEEEKDELTEIKKDTEPVTFFDDKLSSDEEDKEPEEGEKKDISPEEGKEGKEGKEDTTTDEEVNLLNMIDNKLLLDIIAEKKGEKGIHEDSPPEPEGKKETPDIKKISLNEDDKKPSDISDSTKTIKLNDTYAFF